MLNSDNHFVSTNYGWIWSAIPKNASSHIMQSIIEIFFHQESSKTKNMKMHVFLKNDLGYNENFCSIKNHPDNSYIIQDLNFYKFICIRDPRERMISAIFDKIIKNNGKDVPEFLNFYRTTSEKVSELTNSKKFHMASIFLLENRFLISDPHFVSQDRLIPKNVSYDKILKFENLSEDWSEMMNEINVPHLLPGKINSHKSNNFIKNIKDDRDYERSLRIIKIITDEEYLQISDFYKNKILN